jgi:adenylate cyclase
MVIEAMLKDPTRLKLAGDERVLTVLFSDLQGFTSHSERYAPMR